MLEETKLPLTLSGLEVVYLTDAVANGDVALGLPDRDAYVALGRALVLLLAGPYNECVYHDRVEEGPYQVVVTLEQAWLMRSKVRTSDLDMLGANIGIGLLHKLYALLLRFNSGVDAAFKDAQDGDQAWPASGPDLLYAGGLI